MINPEHFVQLLLDAGVRLFSGVPDSLLKGFCRALDSRNKECKHIITANEGGAVGVAIGHYLATSQVPVVYMQNSGIGNAINPLCSLADPEVYAIPLLLIIGWRGELDDQKLQIDDEPQHVKQGKVTLQLLQTLGIPFTIIGPESNDDSVNSLVESSIEVAQKNLTPFAIVVRKDTFQIYPNNLNNTINRSYVSREQMLKWVLNVLPITVPIISSTGMLSRELYELRTIRGESHDHDFLTIGGMGHASHIALGVALEFPDLKVVCLDGDGALLMHMGGLTNVAGISNLIHIVFNNGVHDSVGGQATQAANLSLSIIAKASGFENAITVSDEESIHQAIGKALKGKDSYFIEIRCNPGNRKNLGRPKILPFDSRRNFQQFLVQCCMSLGKKRNER